MSTSASPSTSSFAADGGASTLLAIGALAGLTSSWHASNRSAGQDPGTGALIGAASGSIAGSETGVEKSSICRQSTIDRRRPPPLTRGFTFFAAAFAICTLNVSLSLYEGTPCSDSRVVHSLQPSLEFAAEVPCKRARFGNQSAGAEIGAAMLIGPAGSVRRASVWRISSAEWRRKNLVEATNRRK